MKEFVALRYVRWVGTVVLAAVLGFALTSCSGRGGGRLGEPLEGSPSFDGPATFGFTFTCEVKGGKAVIRGQLEYHDDAADYDLHGVVDPLFTTVATCEAAAEQLNGLPVVQFEGEYRPQNMDPAMPDDLERGRFNVQVFDQGEPGRTNGDITGDSFSIALAGGRYAAYTRGGYIEAGNIQVD